MKKYCPPGVLCIENTTMFFLLFIIVLGGFVLSSVIKKINLNMRIFTNPNHSGAHHDSHSHSHSHQIQSNRPGFFGIFNHPSNVFLNPHAPPLKTNGMYHPNNSSDPRGIPINIETQSTNSNYSQMGVLTRENGKETILPLMGRVLISNRSKWQYYTISDKSNVKLPIYHKNKNSTNEYGCDELFNGDKVYVEGYRDTFVVSIYENSAPRYIPYL
jgi:hypothetical protein